MLEASALKTEHEVRVHWGIENSLYWVLDVAFNEDKSLKTNTNAVQNFSTINRIALNLLKKDTSKKIGVKGKRIMAGWDNNFHLQILKN